MRKLLVLLATLGFLAATAGPATAITGNYVQDNDHPFVGLVVFYDENGEFYQRCSGSLLTPTVFLTAGHCTQGATSARIYFQQDAGANLDDSTEIDRVTGYPEYCAPGTLGVTCATSSELYNYGYTIVLPNTRDAGLVILDQPIAMPEYGVLALPGGLDALATGGKRQQLTFTASGYGLTLINPVKFESYRTRLMAQAHLTNLNSFLNGGFNLQINGNGKDRGGICSGDSGGPVFLGGYTSNVIVAVNSFGSNEWCRGTGFAYRTDTAAVLAWILDTAGPAGADIDFVEI